MHQQKHFVAQERTVLLHAELVMFSAIRQMAISTATIPASSRPAALMDRVTAVMKDIFVRATRLGVPGAALM
jgi:hypothetical protein